MRRKEGLLHPKPEQDYQLEFILSCELPQRLKEAEHLVERSDLTRTEEGEICLLFGLTQSLILRSRLREPSSLLASSLMETTDGEAYNPHRRIDEIGARLIERILVETGITFDLHTEEEKQWKRIAPDGHLPLIVVVDPLDGTGSIKKGLFDQATGILVADSECNFRAGLVASLVNHEMVLVEEESLPYFFSFDEGKMVISPRDLIEKETQSLEEAVIAALPRRIPRLKKETSLFSRHQYPDNYFPSFGGYVLLSMLRGQIDAAIDPLRGQAWYEAVLWGWMGEKSGLIIVTDERGERIDFSRVLQEAHQGLIGERVRLVMSRERKLHQEILEELRLKEEVIFDDRPVLGGRSVKG